MFSIENLLRTTCSKEKEGDSKGSGTCTKSRGTPELSRKDTEEEKKSVPRIGEKRVSLSGSEGEEEELTGIEGTCMRTQFVRMRGKCIAIVIASYKPQHREIL